MRVMSVAAVVLLAGAVAWPAVASAKGAKVPPGACAVGKRSVLAAAAICSYNCNASTSWCSQQMCVNGGLVQVLPCYGQFCAAKCGG